MRHLLSLIFIGMIGWCQPTIAEIFQLPSGLLYDSINKVYIDPTTQTVVGDPTVWEQNHYGLSNQQLQSNRQPNPTVQRSLLMKLGTRAKKQAKNLASGTKTYIKSLPTRLSNACTYLGTMPTGSTYPTGILNSPFPVEDLDDTSVIAPLALGPSQMVRGLGGNYTIYNSGGPPTQVTRGLSGNYTIYNLGAPPAQMVKGLGGNYTIYNSGSPPTQMIKGLGGNYTIYSSGAPPAQIIKGLAGNYTIYNSGGLPTQMVKGLGGNYTIYNP